MNTKRLHSTNTSCLEFVTMFARDVVRLAVGSEGLDGWLRKYGGHRAATSAATRSYAFNVFGDTDEADILNAAMVLEIDRILKVTAKA